MCVESTRATATRTWPLLLAVLAALAVTRLAGLGVRLPHQDEMTHQWLSEMLAFEGWYRASPVYHGPLPYHLQAGVMRLLGSDLWVARLVPAMAGIGAALALVALTAREHGRASAMVLGGLVVASPSWLYYSRFDGHDTLILLATASMAWGRWYWSTAKVDRALWIIGIALAAAWCTKLNALFLVGALAAWPVVRAAVYRTEGRSAPDLGLARRAGPTLSTPARATIVTVAAAMVAIVVALFVTTWWAHRTSASGWDATWLTIRAATVDGLTHWIGIDRQPRLRGPFHYYAALLLLYEPLLVAGAALAVGRSVWTAPRTVARDATLASIAGVAIGIAAWPVRDTVYRITHAHPAHLALLPLLVVLLWWAARARVRVDDEAGAWWTWLALTQTLLYAYAGEKVPWLSVHVALPWMMLAAPALAGAWPRLRIGWRLCLVALGSVTVWGAVCATTWTRSDPAEPLVQMEYAAETHALMARLARDCPTLVSRGQPCIGVMKSAAWPARWYLRALDGAVQAVDAGDRKTLPFVFVPARRTSPAGTHASLADTHLPTEVRFTTWGTWLPWLSRPDPGALWRFLWRRESLGRRYGQPYELWVRRDIARQWHLD